MALNIRSCGHGSSWWWRGSLLLHLLDMLYEGFQGMYSRGGQRGVDEELLVSLFRGVVEGRRRSEETADTRDQLLDDLGTVSEIERAFFFKARRPLHRGEASGRAFLIFFFAKGVANRGCCTGAATWSMKLSSLAAASSAAGVAMLLGAGVAHAWAVTKVVADATAGEAATRWPRPDSARGVAGWVVSEGEFIPPQPVSSVTGDRTREASRW